MKESGRKHDLDIGYTKIFLTSISTKTSLRSISTEKSLGSILTEISLRCELS